MENLEILQEKLVNIQNDIIELYTNKEKLWKYHPDNPDGEDIKIIYQHYQNTIEGRESELKTIEDKIKLLESMN